MIRRAAGGGLPGGFWRIWSGAVAANLGDGIAFVAIQLIAVRLGASPAELAAVGVAQRVPMLFLGLVAGGLADRADRRLTMVAIQVLRVVVIGSLAVMAVTGSLSLPALLIAALALGIGESFFDTFAVALLPMVVGRAQLVAANGRLWTAETLMGSFVGPTLGALLVGVSIPLALSGGALGFGVAAACLMLLPGTFRPPASGDHRSFAGGIVDGARYVSRHPLLRALTTVAAFHQLGVAALFTMLALYAVAPGPMGLSEAEFGLLYLSFGGGSLAATLVAGAFVRSVGRARMLQLTTAAIAVGLAVPVVTAEPIIVGSGNLLTSFALTSFGITNVSLRQAVTPPGILGRVNATYRTTGYVASVGGAALGGLVGEMVGLRAAFAVGALLALGGLVAALTISEPAIADAERMAPAPAT